MPVRLYDVAHSRAGDKGVHVTLSLIPYAATWYPTLQRHVTAGWVYEQLADLLPHGVVRHELPNLPALLFVGQRPVSSGVTTSLALDTHGKSLSYALLDLTLDLPEP